MAEPFEAGTSPVSMLIGDAVVRIADDVSVQEVAAALVASGVGALAVGEGDRPEAVVSERDVVRAVADGRDLSSTPVLDVASPDLIWCDVAATVDEVAELMNDRYVRHVLVEDGGRLVGIVSARDLVGIYSSAADLE
jgi:CBS domain-containing protein